MTKTALQIDDALSEVEILAERAGVLIDDFDQGYLGQNIKGMDDAWKVMPPFHDTARIKTDIANSIIYDLQNQLKELRALVIKAGEAV